MQNKNNAFPLRARALLWTVILQSLLFARVFSQEPDSALAIPVPDIAAAKNGRETNGKRSTAEEEKAFTFREMDNTAFYVGERLVFDVAWGPFVAGTAVMEIPDTLWFRERPCYRIVMTAELKPFLNVFHKVRDRVESVMDMGGLFPWRFEKNILEGKHRSRQVVLFHPESQTVTVDGKNTFQVPSYVQEMLSSFYFVRTLGLEVGRHFDLDNYGDGKVYPLKVLVLRKERIRVPVGRFDCIVIEPVMRVEGIFEESGKLTIWLSDDDRRIPVLMKSRMSVGSIDIRLRSLEGPGVR